jgi:hypothetical protein
MQTSRQSIQITVSICWSLLWIGHVCAEPAVSLPDGYSKCILENATAVKGVTTDNALDTLLLACIKLHEEAIGGPEISKVKLSSVSYGAISSVGGVGLIIQIYNGSPYDITGLAVVITDKRIKEQRTYRYNQFIQYYRGPGIVTGFPAPQYRRFMRSLSEGEYVFPLELPGVRQDDFFKKFEVTSFTASGIR